MREILFRGQYRRYGEKVRMGDGEKLPSIWVYGGVLQGKGDFSIIYGSEDENDIHGEKLKKWPVYTDTLGQYTGFTDKNGKRIYEYDIIRFETHDHIPTIYYGTVIFQNGHYVIEYLSELARKYCWNPSYHTIGQKERWQDHGAGGEITYTYEVIGNVLDNPDML